MNLKAMLEDQMARDNLSQREVARRSGLSNTTISRILNGSSVEFHTAQKLAEYLGVSLSSVIDYKDSEETAEARIVGMLERYPDLREAMDRLISIADEKKITPSELDRLIGYIEGWVASKEAGNDG